jgi:predicted dehydrogenase
MVGYGFMGKVHSNAWRQAPYFFPLKTKVELHTICGRTSAAVQTARAQLGWQFAATDWQEVVESPLIEVVDIVSPTESHAEIALAAARAGKHVLCEKPLAPNAKQATAMLAAVQKAKVGHMVCHNYRFAPAIAQAKKLIAEGALGKILHYHARYAQDWLAETEAATRSKAESSASSAHGDLCVHLVDLGRYLVGEFKDVCALMDTLLLEHSESAQSGSSVASPARKKPKQRAGAIADDVAIVTGRFENGAMANLEATRCAPGRKNQVWLEINGSRGSLFFDFEDLNWLKFYDGSAPTDRQGFRDILVTQPGGIHPYTSHWWGAGNSLGYEHTFTHAIADFVNACAERKPVSPSFEDGLKNQRVVEAMEESVKTRKWVRV